MKKSDASLYSPASLNSDLPFVCPRKSDPSSLQLITTGSTSTSRYNSLSPTRCSCKVHRRNSQWSSLNKNRLHCVPWFTHKYRKHQAYKQEEDLVVKSVENVKHECTWYRLEARGQIPVKRFKHGAVMLGRRMFIVGGICSKGIINDVRELQLGSSEWKLWQSDGGPPCAGHSLVFWERKLLVVGGHIEPLNHSMEVYAFDLGTSEWQKVEISGEIPMSRIGHSILHLGSVLVMFGGEDVRGQLRNDVYILDLKTLAWLPSSTTGSKPSPRKGHSAACYGSRYLWIFGGKSRTSYLSDIHCLDLRTMEWVSTKPKGNVIPRAGHGSAIVGHRWYIIGGQSNDKDILGTLVFDLSTQTWSVVNTVAPNSPLANDGISVVNFHHRGRDFLMTYGGHGFYRGFQHTSEVYVMMLPQVFELQNSFQIKKASRVRTLFSRLTGGKAPRRKISHPDRHTNLRPLSQSSLLTERQLPQTEQATPPPVSPRMSMSTLESSNQETIEMLLREKDAIKNKLEAALVKIDKLQQDFMVFQMKETGEAQAPASSNGEEGAEEKLVTDE